MLLCKDTDVEEEVGSTGIAEIVWLDFISCRVFVLDVTFNI